MRPAFLFFFIFLAGAAAAQKDTTRAVSAGVGYFAQGGAHPGFIFSLEKNLAGDERFQFLVGAKAGLYFHFRNNTGAFVMAQSGQRYRIYKHLSAEHFIGIGYLQSFLNGGDAYYVNASGQIQKASKLGNPHFMPSFSFGMSYELKRHARIFVRPMVYWVIPFNQSSLVQFAVEAGASIRIRR